MIRKTVFLLLICATHPVWSQKYYTPRTQGGPVSPRQVEKLGKWVQGSVVLVTGDTVPCELNYNPAVEEGLVQVKDNGNRLSLSVKEVSSFFYFDSEENRTRRYYAVPVYLEDTSITREYFLEHIYDNPSIAILCRRTIRYYNYPYDPVTHVMAVDVNFLLNVKTGKIRSCNEKEALALMEDKADQVRSYMKTNNIKLKKEVDDYIMVFNYYASL